MLISIIVPVHKTNSYFRQCVESALSQSYRNTELILACNGDLTTEDCKKFLNLEDNRIVFIRTNSGRHNARNEGIYISKGDFIQFLDYDDVLLPQKLESQIQLISSYEELVLISQWKKFREDIAEPYIFPFDKLFEEPNLEAKELIKKLGVHGGFLATGSWLISRNIIKDIKWKDFPNDDAVFFSSVLKRNPRIKMVPKIQVGYRIHDDNASSLRTKEDLNKLLLGWRIIKNELHHFQGKGFNLYMYRAYIYLMTYSKQLSYYKMTNIIFWAIIFGVRAGIGFRLFSQIKKGIVK